jgi:amino acid transporter
VLLGFLALVNYRGVHAGANLSNFFTVSKLLPLGVFLIAGTLFVLLRHPRVPPLPSSATSAQWIEAVLLLAFAYGGYEAAMMPLGEAKNPRRDAPFALFTAMVALLVIYAGVQVLVVRILPHPASSERPLAAAARLFMGAPGATLLAVGALVSIYGYLSANVLNTPRLTFALAERRDFPSFFGQLHPRFHTPYISIFGFVALVWVLAYIGNFRWNAFLSAVARLFTYGSACLSLLVLRRTQPNAGSFRLPAGHLLALLGLGFCVALMTRMGKAELLMVIITCLIALVNWLWVRQPRENVET